MQDAPVRDAQWRWEPRVLVVDDDPVCQLAARRLFKNLGVAADVVADGSDAVRASGDWPYVAVFMDCGTEAVDGTPLRAGSAPVTALTTALRWWPSPPSHARCASPRGWIITLPSRCAWRACRPSATASG
jgi:hypothetical protein